MLDFALAGPSLLRILPITHHFHTLACARCITHILSFYCLKFRYVLASGKRIFEEKEISWQQACQLVLDSCTCVNDTIHQL